MLQSGAELIHYPVVVFKVIQLMRVLGHVRPRKLMGESAP
jgi:hypothetical protein